MSQREHQDVSNALAALRARLERAFRPDSAAPGTDWTLPSAGHCAAVAAIVHELYGGEFLSAFVQGQSHWLNRIYIGTHPRDVDLTGDQFSFPAIQISEPYRLYAGLRIRHPDELHNETIGRALLLARRAGFAEVVHALEMRLATREIPREQQSQRSRMGFDCE